MARLRISSTQPQKPLVMLPSSSVRLQSSLWASATALEARTISVSPTTSTGRQGSSQFLFLALSVAKCFHLSAYPMRTKQARPSLFPEWRMPSPSLRLCRRSQTFQETTRYFSSIAFQLLAHSFDFSLPIYLVIFFLGMPIPSKAMCATFFRRLRLYAMLWRTLPRLANLLEVSVCCLRITSDHMEN